MARNPLIIFNSESYATIPTRKISFIPLDHSVSLRFIGAAIPSSDQAKRTHPAGIAGAPVDQKSCNIRANSRKRSLAAVPESAQLPVDYAISQGVRSRLHAGVP